MGLLIGGSAITVIEFLDLVLYNIIRKCDEKRRKATKVSDSQENVNFVKQAGGGCVSLGDVNLHSRTPCMTPVETNAKF